MGFRFRGDVSISEYHNFQWRGSPGEDCRYCPEFVTLIDLDGETFAGQVCLGSGECFEYKNIKRRGIESFNGGVPAACNCHCLGCRTSF